MITPLRLAAIVAAGAAALACTAAAPHASAVASVSTVASAFTAASVSTVAPTWSDDSDWCPFTAGPDYLEGGGGDSQVIQDNGHAFMGCGDGPIISLEDVDGDTAVFALHGDRVRVHEGATERIGPYRVHVIHVRADRVELELRDPD